MRHYSIFTKPWKDVSVRDLARKVRKWGFDAVEFPLRPGYQAAPEDADVSLPRVAKAFADEGVTIASVASSPTERVMAACAASGVKILRIMAPVDRSMRYRDWEVSFRASMEDLVPFCRQYGVTVGVQNHYGRMASSTMELYRLVEGFDPRHIAAIWDTAHSGLAGEEPEQAIDIIFDHLCLVNFKNAFYRRANGPEGLPALWTPYFTLGCHGAAHYPRIAAALKTRGWIGDICLPAEYTDEDQVEGLAPIDLAYVKMLMGDDADEDR